MTVEQKPSLHNGTRVPITAAHNSYLYKLRIILAYFACFSKLKFASDHTIGLFAHAVIATV